MSEGRLLDDLEDAQEEVDRDRRQLAFGLWLLFGGLVPGIGWLVLLSIMSSMGQNWGTASGFPSVLLCCLAVAGGIITGGTWFEDLPKSRKTLKRAQRAHRNYLLSNNREDIVPDVDISAGAK